MANNVYEGNTAVNGAAIYYISLGKSLIDYLLNP